jgi:protein TonB
VKALAISAGAHALVAIVIAIVWQHASPETPRDDAVSVEIAPHVAPAPTARDLAVLAPTLPRHAAPAPSHAAAHAPVRKAAAPPTDVEVAHWISKPTASTTVASAASSDDRVVVVIGGSSGNGTGGGGGGGGGSGTGGVDLHAPPVPIDASSARVLPYTEAALHARISGDVVLSLEIDAAGSVTGATVMKRLGYGLDDIAIDVAKRFRFRPARDVAGAATTGRVSWRFHFAPP